MKKDKVISTLSYIGAVLFYIFAIINFVNDDTSMCVFWIALGSSFLGCGSTFGRKANRSDDDSKNNKAD